MTKNLSSTSNSRNVFRTILVATAILSLIYSSCYNNADETSKSRDIESYSYDLPLSKENAITQDDSRLSPANGERDEYPKPDDLMTAITFFVLEKENYVGRPEWDASNFKYSYLPKGKEYLTSGSVKYKIKSGKTIERNFLIGLNYLGGFPLKKSSWEVASFTWM